jgi:hypothetical protein
MPSVQRVNRYKAMDGARQPITINTDLDHALVVAGRHQPFVQYAQPIHGMPAMTS